MASNRCTRDTGTGEVYLLIQVHTHVKVSCGIGPCWWHAMHCILRCIITWRKMLGNLVMSTSNPVSARLGDINRCVFTKVFQVGCVDSSGHSKPATTRPQSRWVRLHTVQDAMLAAQLTTDWNEHSQSCTHRSSLEIVAAVIARLLSSNDRQRQLIARFKNFQN